MPKIIDKINSFRKKQKRVVNIDEIPDLETIDESKQQRSNNLKDESIGNYLPKGPKECYYSFEFFPPKTEAGLDNLLTRIDRMSTRLDPLFIDVTWGESGSTSARSMAIAAHAQRYCGVDVLLHLTCTGITRAQLDAVLKQAKSHGVQNILALRGDPPRGKRSWCNGDISGGECDRAIDLVRFIRQEYGDYFCIAVAGHPEHHPASQSEDQELNHLREKVDAGADFIITQFFYDADLFLTYVRRCRSIGITCPILPGILPIQSYTSFIRMAKSCDITVPKHILDRLEPVKEDDEAAKIIGCEIAVEIAMKILNTPAVDGGMDGVHFYTLNLERSVTRILMAMNVVSTLQPADSDNKQEEKSGITASPGLSAVSSGRRQYPWRPSAMERREKEDVRPINWANRPKSYVMRTEDWDEFPNGRWGDSTSPAFGELSELQHFYSFSLGSDEDRLGMLGQNPTKPQDIYEVFAKYVEGKVPHLPWCETALKPESFTIQGQLASLNRAGFLSINSQPPVNGVPSSHPVFGWGGRGGYIYQKSYIEFFVSPENAQVLIEMVAMNESMNLYAVNNDGKEMRAGSEEGGITALTWGVFPNREILQPTIFDPDTFLIWAEEAFSLWTSMWLNLYEFGSTSFDLIEDIRDTYYLVAIIDNDFMSFNEQQQGGKLLEEMLKFFLDR